MREPNTHYKPRNTRHPENLEQRQQAQGICKEMLKTLIRRDVARHFEISETYLSFVVGMQRRESREYRSFMAPMWVINHILDKDAQSRQG